jgi:hypothetical protein
MRKRDIARNMARESAIGCVTHFLLAMAGVIFWVVLTHITGAWERSCSS